MTDESRELLGRFLHIWRGSANMSQAELARRLNVSRALVNLLEKGKRTPSREVAESIVHLFTPPPVEVRQFLEAAGFAPPPIQQHVSSLLLVVMADDPDNLTVSELARLDIWRAGSSWQQLVQTLVTLRTGDLALARPALEQIVTDYSLSPVIRLVATQKLAQVLRIERQLDAANKLLTDALASLDLRNIIMAAPHHGELLRALLADEQGVVALRRGYYREAFVRFENSRADYLGLRGETIDEPNGDAAKDIERLGLALSAQRLAEAAMFLELDTANEYCKEAEAYLSTLRDSTEKSDVLRRIAELRAWAYARAQQYDEAITLHKEAIEAAEQAHDRIDEIKNWTYLGDDWFHKIEAAIEEAYVRMRGPNGQPITISSGHIWSEQVLRNRGEAEQWLVEAELAYSTARELQKRYTHAQSFGHILRGLASIMRLRRQYFEANAVLIQAEQHERAHKLDSRLPVLFEARADLYWDQGMPELAVRWYQSALVAMQRILTTWRERQHSESGVLAGHVSRIERKLRRLELTVASSNIDREVYRVFISREGISSGLTDAIHSGNETQVDPATALSASRLEYLPRQAHEILHEIRDTVIGVISRSGRVPITMSEVGAIWLQELADFEQLPGTRILAQNTLSLSLATQPPSALRAITTESASNPITSAYQVRRDAFLSSVYGAQESLSPGSITCDLCSRSTLEASAEQEETRDRVREALRLMTDYPSGYMLGVLNHSMPFGFAVKGSRTLVEIPTRFAHKAGMLTNASENLNDEAAAAFYCYRFDDPMLADTLRALFAMLFDLVGRAGEEEPTADWLHELVDRKEIDSRALGI